MKNNSWIPVTEKLPPALETYETQMRKREIMVYLREILKHNKAKLFQYINIELAAYLYIQSLEDLSNQSFELSPEEEVALVGYKKENVAISKVVSIVSKAPIKGISATSNIYKFAGLYLYDGA